MHTTHTHYLYLSIYRNCSNVLYAYFPISHNLRIDCRIHRNKTQATLTESAVNAMQRKPHLGTPVNYSSLPDILYKDILPNKWKIPITQTEIDNIIKVSGVYSKGTGDRHKEFTSDSETKEKEASVEIRDAAAEFLSASYKVLEAGGQRTADDDEAENSQ